MMVGRQDVGQFRSLKALADRRQGVANRETH